MANNFEVHYSFDIKDKVTEELSHWERGSFEIEFPTAKDFDSAKVKSIILSMARKHCHNSTDFISYSNYFKIIDLGEIT